MKRPKQSKFKIYPQGVAKLKQIIKESFSQVVDELDLEFQAVISDSNAFADIGVYNQDIIWTGRLKESQQLEISTDRNNVKASWRWNPFDPESGE